MEVKTSKAFPDLPGYSIEWGYATWTKDDKGWSIRNRYSNQDGRFNYSGSSEVPWEDFKRMIIESIREEQFSNQELLTILSEISEHLKTM